MSGRKSITQIKAMKQAEKISVLTAYDFRTAQLLDGLVDILLVGDSLGMVIYGFDSTLPVTLEIMTAHGTAVAKATSKSLVVVDMPFGSYQESPEQAFRNSAKLISESGAQAVKIEGGLEMVETVNFLTSRGIPVMAHIGLQPQSFNAYGGYKVQGKEQKEADKILLAAKKLEAAGAFAVVLEAIPKVLADKITKSISIPTIGIGASPNCDGQVLVINDLLGLNPTPAKFVKTYADFSNAIAKAVKNYTADVKNKKFPGKDNCY